MVLADALAVALTDKSAVFKKRIFKNRDYQNSTRS